jgi:hypothetical protein
MPTSTSNAAAKAAADQNAAAAANPADNQTSPGRFDYNETPGGEPIFLNTAGDNAAPPAASAPSNNPFNLASLATMSASDRAAILQALQALNETAAAPDDSKLPPNHANTNTKAAAKPSSFAPLPQRPATNAGWHSVLSP